MLLARTKLQIVLEMSPHPAVFCVADVGKLLDDYSLEYLVIRLVDIS